MKNKKAVKIVGIISVITISVFSLMPNENVNASAVKSSWTYGWAVGSSHLINEKGRVKDTYSSGYMDCSKCTSLNTGGASTGSYRAVMYGSKTEGSGYVLNSYNGKSSKKYTFSVGTVNSNMINYVKESGCGYANLYCEPVYGAYVKFEGTWSPDV